MTPKPGLADHIAAQATPGEMDRQWEVIEARLSRRRSRWLPLSLVLAGATAAILLVLFHRGSATRWTSHEEGVPVALDDGSRLQLQPDSDVSLLGQQPGKLELQVVRGGARFQVLRNPQRRFQVVAGTIEVMVTGTAFTVSLLNGSPRVSVEHGEVEVRRRHEAPLLARLHAGEAWPAPPPPAVHVDLPPAAAPSEPPPTAAPRPEAAPAAAPASARAGTVARVPTDPRRLLEQANAARRSGDAAQAAALFASLGEHFPHDARAALAWFELGRLRMEALADLPGALAALKRSIALAPRGVFREDADACLATVYSRLRERAQCEGARRAYLDRYPAGVHAAEMSALDCGR